jgi:hypothetical protein
MFPVRSPKCGSSLRNLNASQPAKYDRPYSEHSAEVVPGTDVPGTVSGETLSSATNGSKSSSGTVSVADKAVQ